MVIEYDHGTQTADLAIYEYITSYHHRMSLWQRIKYCYKVLVNKKPYADQITLTKMQLQDLSKFLNQLNI